MILEQIYEVDFSDNFVRVSTRPLMPRRVESTRVE